MVDYLDPKKKKAHVRRLYIGYVLIAIAIGLAAWILLYIGNGFYLNKNGEVIQNGLVYVESSPSGAKISLNGKQQNDTTDARLVIPESTYELILSADKYRPWRRTFDLTGGSVRRITYPRMYPVSLKTDVTQTFGEVPDMVESSVNRRLIMLHMASSPLQMQIFSTDEPLNAPIILTLNSDLITNPQAKATYRVSEWTENAEFVLVERTTSEMSEYLLLKTSQINEQRNITRELNIPSGATVTMRDRKENQYVVYLPADKSIRFADLNNKTLIDQPVAQNVLAFKAFESDKILYATPSETDKTKTKIRLFQSGKVYEIREVLSSEKYFLDMAKLGRTLVMLAGSQAEKKIMVYRNPVEYLQSNQNVSHPVATTALRVTNPQFASFSASASIVMLYGEGEFAAHEFEADRSYNYKLDLIYDQTKPLRWMDGARLNIVSGDYLYSVDFDGSNLEKLIPGRAAYGAYFDRDYTRLYSFLTNKDSSLFQMTTTRLIAD